MGLFPPYICKSIVSREGLQIDFIPVRDKEIFYSPIFNKSISNESGNYFYFIDFERLFLQLGLLTVTTTVLFFVFKD